MHPVNMEMPPLAAQLPQLSPFLRNAISFCANHHLLPESYLYGLMDVERVGVATPAFIFGKVYEHGQWFYFPALLSLKWSVGLLGLLAMAIYAFATGRVRLVPIDGAGRARLVREAPSFAPSTIQPGTLAGLPATPTVATRALWIVRDSVPDSLVYGIAKALFQPSNRLALAASHPAASALDAGEATKGLPAALHPGATRYYREQGQKL